ncbi:Protein CBR-DML-1 [Caenorhabditis briggsae]|uniref:Uncharacterized protein n=2 Tax=Caenorhabditis briggsae TaxID=6238 RepID=A0AAE9F2B0_CAEBR|nr:Protein CBR-DML-1 [Caenorhabditis briggsae]ULT98231.1 hypothetical protein L3Y34_005800 [Caenorhabditis briggsae]UMM31390.1 hypothetical protein L5515_012885 [Caenorhabditis briggsae]CAP32316.1 Protein CBR-DML-1 [Caenorhabditis briggsae]
MRASFGESFNVSEEMRDLVHQAENWAISDPGFSRIPEASAITRGLGKQVLTRAAVLLMKQMGVGSIENFVKGEKMKETIMANIKTEEDDDDDDDPMEEFRNRMQNGKGSPCTPRTKAALMAEFFPVGAGVPKIDFEEEPKKMFLIPKNLPRKSDIKPMFTSTPISKTPRRSSGVVVEKPMDGDMTPFENRASRLRRQKLEESRKSFDTSFNSSYSRWK